jgi:hypothetical protein
VAVANHDYDGMNFADAADARARERAQLEESALLRLLQRAHTLGVIVAFENLEPVLPAHRAPLMMEVEPAAPRRAAA